MLRGDVDRFFRALRRDHPTPPTGPLPCLDHVRTIAQYYGGLSQQERLLLLAWAKKEESGIGMIPLALSAVPFFGLLVASRLEEPLRRVPLWATFALWGLASLLLVAGYYMHQRQKAYTMLHIVLLEQAIKRGEAQPEQAASLPYDRQHPLTPQTGPGTH